MRERRAAHVRPLAPSGERLRSRQVRASAPAPDLVRRYRPVRTNKGVPAPLGLGVVALFLALGVVMLIVGGNILLSVAGQLAHAFDSAISQVSSLPPATIAPSGVALDTPVLDTPDHDGYTNQPTLALSGSVPGAAVGATGFKVRVYSIASDGTRTQVAEVDVGATTRFTTPAVTLVEGPNTFVASLVTPSTEGQPSPKVVYFLDTKLPTLTVVSQPDTSSQTGSSVVIAGKSDPGVTITIRNQQAPGGGLSSKIVGPDGKFAITVGVVAGSNSIQVTATDQAGNVTTTQVTVNRSLGKVSAYLSVKPARFRGAGPTPLTLTVRVTSANGGPVPGASVVYTVVVQGLGPIQSPQVTTDQTGTATWKVTISGATAGTGQATALVNNPDGSQIRATETLTTT